MIRQWNYKRCRQCHHNDWQRKKNVDDYVNIWFFLTLKKQTDDGIIQYNPINTIFNRRKERERERERENTKEEMNELGTYSWVLTWAILDNYFPMWTSHTCELIKGKKKKNVEKRWIEEEGQRWEETKCVCEEEGGGGYWCGTIEQNRTIGGGSLYCDRFFFFVRKSSSSSNINNRRISV